MARCTGTSKTTSFWNITAWVVWTIALIVLVARPLLLSQRGTSFDTYSIAGSHWLHGEQVYTQWMGFVYSPVVATFFAPFALIPTPIANIFWRLINAAALLGGLAALLRSNVFASIKPQRCGVAYLLMLPLALGNIDISQANPMVAGLIMLAIAAVYTKHWNRAAFCMAIATLFKIYPIAVALLICVIVPRHFTWRFFIALFLLSLLPFLFQNWSFVAQQYNAWIATRIADNRRNWPIEKLPLDLWFIVHWLLHLPISQKAFTLIQLGGAAAIAVFCTYSVLRRWNPNRVLVGLFCLSAVWMTLCGPATESYTYLLLAAPAILALLESLHLNQMFWIRFWVWLSVALQFLAVVRASFMPHFKPFWILAILPISALIFLGYSLAWLLNDDYWPDTDRSSDDIAT